MALFLFLVIMPGNHNYLQAKAKSFAYD